MPILPNLPVDWLEKVHIRPARETDLTAMEWEGEYSHFRNIYADTFLRARQGYALIWLAEYESFGLIGQAFVQLLCDRKELADGRHRAYMFAFRVRPAFRRMGLGSRILVFIENDLRKRGFSSLTLNVAKENSEARDLYHRHGYRQVAEEPGNWSYRDHDGIWRQVNEPAWRMLKDL